MRRFLLVILLTPIVAVAQVQPEVRVEVTPQEVTVGKPVRMRITVLVPTWFPEPPQFPSFELPNAITRLPSDSSYPTSERIGGETWSGIVRNYELFPLAAANYRLDNASLTVTFADPGSDPIVTTVALPEVAFRAFVPAGAERLDPYIAGTRLTLTREVDGDVANLAPGDALVVRTVIELEGLPAIFLPPVGPPPDMPGVSVYADAPVIEDNAVARRIESATLVFDAGGEFVLPEIALSWWNLDEQRIERASAPETRLSVSGAPPMTSSRRIGSADWQTVLGGVVFLVILAVSLVALARYARRAWQAWRAHYVASEPFAFRELRRRGKSADASEIYADLVTWLERLQPGLGPREFAERSGDTQLDDEINKLVNAAFTSEDPGLDRKVLIQRLARARTRFLKRAASGRRGVLPPLNPGVSVPPEAW